MGEGGMKLGLESEEADTDGVGEEKEEGQAGGRERRMGCLKDRA